MGIRLTSRLKTAPPIRKSLERVGGREEAPEDALPKDSGNEYKSESAIPKNEKKDRRMTKRWGKIQQTSCEKRLLGTSERINIYNVE